MLLRNFDAAQVHCNGTRYIVMSTSNNVIEGVVADGTHKGKRLFIPRIMMTPSDNIYPFTFTRKRFPIRSAFSFIANKSQGQTLKRVGIYLPKQMFCHGQLYVAMSRVGESRELKIYSSDYYKEPHERSKHLVDNVVYPEII